MVVVAQTFMARAIMVLKGRVVVEKISKKVDARAALMPWPRAGT